MMERAAVPAPRALGAEAVVVEAVAAPVAIRSAMGPGILVKGTTAFM